MLLKLFNFLSYREFVIEIIKQNKSIRGFKTKLSKACGCQPAYFSQMLSERVELTLEHAYGLCQYLKMNESETEYFILLVQYERAGTRELKSYLKDKITEKKKKHSRLSKRVEHSVINRNMNRSEYYSDWLYAAIHIYATSSNYYGTADLSQRLGVPQSLIERYLKRLIEMDILVPSGREFKNSKSSLHLDSDSTLNLINNTNWRLRAIEDIRLSSENAVHYTSVFSMSPVDFEKWRFHLLDFIENHRNAIGISGSEEVYSFQCDFFRIGTNQL